MEGADVNNDGFMNLSGDLTTFKTCANMLL